MAMTPGNRHSFGVKIEERFLLAPGWQVRTELEGTSDDIAEVAKNTWFAVVGLTAGPERQRASRSTTIGQIRRESRNQAVGIMVGAPMFTANPKLAHDVGAEAKAPNAPSAVILAQKLFDLSAAAFHDTAGQ